MSPSVGTGAVVVQFPSTRYSAVAPSSVPPTVKLPSLVKRSSAAEPESVSSVSVGASGAVVSPMVSLSVPRRWSIERKASSRLKL
ncbi:hypothetical protein FCV52_12715 [Vibrio kanaloae]|uniref:Uncharacterized protein n=1 Tax=Vibrio kanaloae TaxID=170673 RepID=A0A4U1YV72_9VIBR|nr:hypothetical protein FCV52_12715 [Vibrio kanaloae]